MIHVADTKTTHGNIFTLFPQYNYGGQTGQYVQVDWMVGNLPWLKFAYHSGESGDLKGMHRTQLMVAMLSNKGYTFSHLHGIKKKRTKDFIATTPDEAVELFSKLYGPFVRGDFNSFLSLHHFLKLYSAVEVYRDVIKSYIKILVTSKAKIPFAILEYANEDS